MARVKRGVTAGRRHKKVLGKAKGYYNARRKVYRTAKQAVIKAGQYAFRDRRATKRAFRALLIARINAAKSELQAAIEARGTVLGQFVITQGVGAGAVDVTPPGRGEAGGGVQPNTRLRLRIEELFQGAGYEIATGPLVEVECHKF